MAGNINQRWWGTSAMNSSFSFHPYPQTSFASSSWIDNHELAAPESWSQLLFRWARRRIKKNYQEKKIENWGRQVLYPPLDLQMEESPQEISFNGYERNHQFQIDGCRWSQTLPSPSPSPCSTNPTSNLNNFSSNKSPRNKQQSDYSSECNSTHTGAVLKKVRIQSPQTTFKVRKEKLGDRITALQQLVSPFGKTDTASVLLEAITHIRFLQNQIEALSSPYLVGGSSKTRNIFQGERKCIFPEDPGQLLNDAMIQKREVAQQEKEEEQPKDLRSRGLCLVPLSCTVHVGNDDCTDYWAPTFGRGFR